MKKVFMAVAVFVMLSGVAYANESIGFIGAKFDSVTISKANPDMTFSDEKAVSQMTAKWNYKYLEVTTKSGAVYKIYPCGLVEKLTWKEVAPNTEPRNSGTIQWNNNDNYILLNSGTESKLNK